MHGLFFFLSGQTCKCFAEKQLLYTITQNEMKRVTGRTGTTLGRNILFVFVAVGLDSLMNLLKSRGDLIDQVLISRELATIFQCSRLNLVTSVV